MKKYIIFICLFFIAVVLFFVLPEKKLQIASTQEQQTVQIDEIDVFLKKIISPVSFVDIKTTEELKSLLDNYEYDKTPRIYVRNFPSDFLQKGDIDTFIRTLLPYILRQNELLNEERKLFLKIAKKLKANNILTEKESVFWETLILKYDVFDHTLLGKINTLYDKIDKISPSLAIAQALSATNNIKENLNAPFDIFRWDNQKQYSRVVYSNLALAVEDYALELNRNLSLDAYREERAIQHKVRNKLSGRELAKNLSVYKKDEKDYIIKLESLFKNFDDYKLDFATFKKGQ